MVNTQLDAALGRIRKFAGPPARGNLTDARLLEQFLLQHDQDAFALLVQRHGPMVQKVCWRVLHHTQDAEDAMQATFLVLARHAASIQKRENLAGWLHSTACRTALRARRDAGRRRQHEREVPRMPHSQPALDLAWRELQAVLDEEIAKLPEKYRVVFVLCCLESRSRPDVAGQLGLKEGTVASRLAYARKLLQQRLTRRGLTLAGVLAAVSLSEQTGQAALPAAVVRATTAVALGFRAGPGAAVPTRVAALAEGISNTLFATRCKLVALVVLVAGLAMAGAGMLPARPADPPAAAPPSFVSPPVRAGGREPVPGPALEEKGDTVTVRGRVLDPDGKPLAGADVCLGWYRGYPLEWWPWTVEPLRPARGGKSGPDGRFCFTLTKKQLYATMRTVTANPWREIQVVAASKGYGPAWRYVTAKEPKELTLRLVRDSAPIRGRVVDLQGRPVAGVRVWLSHLTVGGNYLTVNAGAGFPAPVQTDKAGRFVIGGFGRDREGALHLAGPTIEHKLVALDTKAPADGGKKGRPPLEIVVGPTKPIEGTVCAGDSGKPLAGVVVYGDRKQHREAVRAVTDARGRFRLVGLPKQARHELVFQPATGQPYLTAMRRVPDSEGLKPIAVDCSLRRGVPVRFRLIDKETRQPVRARVQYTPLKKNPSYAEAEEMPGLVPTRVFQEVLTPDADQFYNLVAYPGPGVILAFGGYSGRTYLPAQLTPADKQNRLDRIDPHMDFLRLAVGYRFLDVASTDAPKPFTIELNPAKEKRKGGHE